MGKRTVNVVKMKITFIGHASILVESHGISILSDPWWNGPCFGAQWWLYPKPYVAAVENQKVDYIYVSHGHHDHFHSTTLKTLNQGSKILVAKDSDLRDAIRKMGFDVIEVSKDKEHQLGNSVSCRIVETGGGDSLMAISDGTETCLNLNDALHASSTLVQDKFVGLLKNFFHRIDYIFCGYGTASHFPNCYIIPGKDKVETAIRRQSHFNRAWARIISQLSPKFAFPFAADVVFLEDDLFWCNEAIHNSERPTQVLQRLYPHSRTIPIDISPGFVIADGRILVNKIRGPMNKNLLTDLYSDSIRRVNSHKKVEHRSVQEVLGHLKGNIDKFHGYLSTFENDYKCLIKLRSCTDAAIEISKRGAHLSVGSTQSFARENYDLIYTTRLQYLKSSLTNVFGHEVLFVGSGGIFEYMDALDIKSNIHREMIVIMSKMDRWPTRVSEGRGTIFRRTKRFIKALIGRAESDLYDLKTWTVFADPLDKDSPTGMPTPSISTPRT